MADAVGLRIGMPCPGLATGAFSGTNFSLNSAARKCASVFRAKEASAISHAGFCVSSVTGTPPTYKISLQGVDAANGTPDGTIKGGGSPASSTFTPPSGSSWTNTFQWVALANSYTPSRGELLSLVVEHSSGTVDASSFISANYGEQGMYSVAIAAPYCLQNTGASYSKIACTPLYGIRGASFRHGNLFTGSYDTATSSTVGHRCAMKFNIPGAIASTFTVLGFRFAGFTSQTSGGRNPLAGLWGSGGVIQDITLDTDVSISPASSYKQYEILFDETNLATLSGGTDYYIGLQVADATSAGVGINGYTYSDANDLLSQPLGTSAYLSTYNGSAWSDNTLVRPCVELILGDITPPSSGGGIMLRRNFDGGF